MIEDTASPSCERDGASSNGTPNHAEIREVAAGVYARQAPESLSPSLWLNREEPAFELKFQLREDQAQAVARWASQHLNLDPHADPKLGNAYRVHGLYFDTPALDVFHRAPGYKKKKYRLRRYGANTLVYLEQKRKSAGKVSKRRVQVIAAELERLRAGSPVDPEWPGHWFHRRISVRKLAPSCFISYERHAYFGENAEGPLRLTLDRFVQSQAANRWTVEEVVNGKSMLAGYVLLELKFRRQVPALFKAMMQDFGLTPGSLSKYRLAIQALGRAPASEEPADG
jgi:hypothetical protein